MDQFEIIDKSPCSKYRPKVIIAQSDYETLEILEKAAIEFDRFDAVFAYTGTEVIDLVNSECFDAVVLGLRFEDITGSTLAYLIHEFDPLMSIMFLTSYKTGLFRVTAEALNCTVCDKSLVKSDPTEVLKQIYVTAMKTPCSDTNRSMTREEVRYRRELFIGYRKLELPSVLSELKGGVSDA